MDNPYLVTVEDLKGQIGEKGLKIIDTRKPSEYAEGHIPDAVNIYDIFTYLCTKETGGHEAMRRHFAGLFGAAGLSGQEPPTCLWRRKWRASKTSATIFLPGTNGPGIQHFRLRRAIPREKNLFN